jgi:glycerophosphoryl diester phosphodiesterase
VSGLGPEKTYFGVLPLNIAQEKIELIKSYELVLHPWTFRAENYFLPTELRLGDPATPDFLRRQGLLQVELKTFLSLGVDGVFCDFPAAAVAARG